MPNNSWDTIRTELSQMLNNNEYARLRPLLEHIQRMASAQYPSPDIVSGLLLTVKSLQRQASQGDDLRELYNQTASGFIQPQWNVQGVVNQANRDIFVPTVIQVFKNVRDELEFEEADPRVIVPVVLLVMTSNEAQELDLGTIFQNYPNELRTDFERLQTSLTKDGVADWLQRYQEIPEDWQPFSAVVGEVNIKQLIEHALSLIEDSQKPLVPDFIDIRTLNDTQNRSKLIELRNYGCIVIMDVISMRHPVIQREFRRSLLDAFPNTLVASIAPIPTVLEIVGQMIVIIEHYVELEFSQRFNVDLDSKCIKASNIVEINRWIKDQVPKLLPTDVKSQIGIRRHWFQGGVRRQ